MSNQSPTARKVRKGTVVSTDMDKTIVVDVEREFEHPLYEKRIRRNKHLKVHDEEEVADPGDVVEIFETRPISKTKRWLLDEILVKQEVQAIELEDEEEADPKEPEVEVSAQGNQEDEDSSGDGE